MQTTLKRLEKKHENDGIYMQYWHLSHMHILHQVPRTHKAITCLEVPLLWSLGKNISFVRRRRHKKIEASLYIQYFKNKLWTLQKRMLLSDAIYPAAGDLCFWREISSAILLRVFEKVSEDHWYWWGRDRIVWYLLQQCFGGGWGLAKGKMYTMSSLIERYTLLLHSEFSIFKEIWDPDDKQKFRNKMRNSLGDRADFVQSLNPRESLLVFPAESTGCAVQILRQMAQELSGSERGSKYFNGGTFPRACRQTSSC